MKWMWEQGKKDEERIRQAAITADMIAKEQRNISTCKICKRIFAEGIPYQKTITGRPKNYICVNCAKNIGWA